MASSIAIAIAIGRCDVCGAQGPLHEIDYRQNTGMLIMRQSRHFTGRACRDCSHTIFVKTTLHTLVLGWWGMISLFVTPIFILNNIACWVRSRSLPRQTTFTRDRLEERREYALNLLDGKDQATVIDVLVKDTGLPEAEVAAWVRALPPRAA